MRIETRAIPDPGFLEIFEILEIYFIGGRIAGVRRVAPEVAPGAAICIRRIPINGCIVVGTLFSCRFLCAPSECQRYCNDAKVYESER